MDAHRAVNCLATAQRIDWAWVRGRVCQHYMDFWAPFEQVHDYRDPDVRIGRKTLTYAKCCKRPELFPPAHGVYKGTFPTVDVRRIARFRLGSHNLSVETDRHGTRSVPWEQRMCTRCSVPRLWELLAPIDDEYHLLFECEAVDDLRNNLPESLKSVMDVRQFLEGDFRSAYTYISQCMLRVDEGGPMAT